MPRVYLEEEIVTLRKLSGGLVLGLLAALAAHTALYGGQHAQGGAYHDVLIQIASALALGFIGIFCALAWSQAASRTDGSIIATRLRERLPGISSVILSAAAWYAGVEATEPQHAAASLLAVCMVLMVAAFGVLRLAHAVTDAVARVAIAIFRARFSALEASWQRPSARLILHQSLLTHFRFARPPPIVLAFPRA